MFKKCVGVAFLVILCGSIAIIGIEAKPANAEPSPVIVDSFPETYASGGGIVLSSLGTSTGTYSVIGQSFNATIRARLTSCKFYLKLYEGNPTVNVTAYLYAMTGTYGNDSIPAVGVPIGVPLAASDQLNSSIVGGSWALYQFNFTGTYPLTLGTKYCIELSALGSSGTFDLSNAVVLAYRAGGTNHAGNMNYYANNHWQGSYYYDLIFYVYGEPLPNPVGGEWIPINTVQILVQTIGSAAVMSAIAASFIGFKRIKKKQN